MVMAMVAMLMVGLMGFMPRVMVVTGMTVVHGYSGLITRSIPHTGHVPSSL